MHYYIEPEIAGELGEHTVLDTSVHPPRVSHLHYQLDGLSGDDILETFPCFIVTKRLKRFIEGGAYSGATFSGVEVSKSLDFAERHPKMILPEFYWLQPHGRAGVDDFGLADDARLVISAQMVHALRNQFQIKGADLHKYED